MTYRPAGEVVDDILERVYGLPRESRITARVLADVVGDPYVDWAGSRSPSAIATACIYVADMAVRGQERMSQVTLAEQAPSSHQTIRKHYAEIPSVFLSEATEADKERIPADVLDRLAALSVAHESGKKLHEIDPWVGPFEDGDGS